MSYCNGALPEDSMTDSILMALDDIFQPCGINAYEQKSAVHNSGDHLLYLDVKLPSTVMKTHRETMTNAAPLSRQFVLD